MKSSLCRFIFLVLSKVFRKSVTGFTTAVIKPKTLRGQEEVARVGVGRAQ